MSLKKSFFLILLLLLPVIACCQEPVAGGSTFTNPLFTSGADPWIILKDGWYYFTCSTGDRLTLRKARNLDGLKQSEQKTVWMPPAGTMYSKELWAPELHFIENCWYIYFAADDGKNINHRMYAVSNPSADPTEGSWEFRGKVADPADKWAIDGSVFRYGGRLYMIWSGWEGDTDREQDIYIAAMKDPLTIDGKRSRISVPEFDWERQGELVGREIPRVFVNEGPVALIHDNRLFIVYSASGCWTDSYCLGMLIYNGSGDLLDPASWKKSPDPVFAANTEAGAYAPGHNSFFKSPDGTEDWIVYHANPAPGKGCGRFRSPRAQRFTWNADGMPEFGRPVAIDKQVGIPSEGAR